MKNETEHDDQWILEHADELKETLLESIKDGRFPEKGTLLARAHELFTMQWTPDFKDFYEKVKKSTIKSKLSHDEVLQVFIICFLRRIGCCEHHFDILAQKLYEGILETIKNESHE